MNWIGRDRESGNVVGAVQATLSLEDGQLQADLAWIIGVANQRQGYATEAAGAMLGWLRTLREAINAEIQAATDHAPVPAPALGEINRWLALAATIPRLEPGGDGRSQRRVVPASDAIRYALARVALDGATQLGTEQRDRLRICVSPTCSAGFYDASRAGTRRWCSMRGRGNW
ncbi:MAG: GNAT family N-acetyltransferase [Solirubrobacteraceae bacterium]